jgi:hypothetical protein
VIGNKRCYIAAELLPGDEISAELLPGKSAGSGYLLASSEKLTIARSFRFHWTAGSSDSDMALAA